jgi:hypothetical protein
MAQLSAVEYMMGFSKGDKLAHRCSGAVSWIFVGSAVGACGGTAVACNMWLTCGYCWPLAILYNSPSLSWLMQDRKTTGEAEHWWKWDQRRINFDLFCTRLVAKTAVQSWQWSWWKWSWSLFSMIFWRPQEKTKLATGLFLYNE